CARPGPRWCARLASSCARPRRRGGRGVGMRARAEPRGAAALGDFTATWRVVPMALAGVGIGVLAAYVALALLRLIGLFTNLFFFQRWDSALVSPAGSTLGPLVVLAPVGGALVIGGPARRPACRPPSPRRWPRCCSRSSSCSSSGSRAA